MREIAIFSGSAHPELAEAICRHLEVPLAPTRIDRFTNDCLEVQLQANCRERDVYLVQPLVPPVQDHLVELLLMLDAARGASAARITAVIPHYAYARSDKKDRPRISIAARLVADLLTTAGADRVLAMTLHSPQVHGFFSVPVDHLHARRELAAHFRRGPLADTVVLSPDLGYAKEAAKFARMLGVPVAAAAKQRMSDEDVVISSIIGEVRGKHVIVIDDEIARGTTMLEVLDQLAGQDVASVRIACTHGLFTDGALARLAARPEVSEIVCTDTVPLTGGVSVAPADSIRDAGTTSIAPARPVHDTDTMGAAPAEPVREADKLRVLSVAAPLAEAVRRIHNGESVSALFDPN